MLKLKTFSFAELSVSKANDKMDLDGSRRHCDTVVHSACEDQLKSWNFFGGELAGDYDKSNREGLFKMEGGDENKGGDGFSFPTVEVGTNCTSCYICSQPHTRAG